MITTDKRLELIERVERTLISKYDKAVCDSISNALLLIIDDYEIMSRTTELVKAEQNTNNEILEMYAASLLTSGRKANTVQAYLFELKRFAEFTQKDFLECNTLDFRRYLASKVAKNSKSTTISNTRNYLSAFYIWLEREGYTETNHMKQILPVKEDKTIEEALSDIEIATVRDSIKSPFERAMFEFLLSSGVRARELTNLKLSDVNFKTGKVHVRNGKGGKDRFTYVTPVCLKYVNAYLMDRKYISDYLFINSRLGTQTTTDGIKYHINRIAKLSGVKRLHPHLLRKTMATNLVKRGMDISLVQELLGHANLDTTKRYVVLDEDKVRAEYFNYA